jgi:transcriptional regulator with XRE-family HTH domain
VDLPFSYMTDTEDTVMKPGSALRALRVQKGWTLAEVSTRTGLSIPTLSKLENNKMSLTYDKLVKISTGLNVELGELFSSGKAPSGQRGMTGRRCINRAGEGNSIETRNYLNVYLATELLHKRFVPIFGELRATSIEEFGEMIRHAGEEFVYVLEGTIEFHTELYAPVKLGPGDSMYFDSGMAHAYLAASPGPCRILSICSASEGQLKAALSEGDSAAPAGEDNPPVTAIPYRRR